MSLSRISFALVVTGLPLFVLANPAHGQLYGEITTHNALVSSDPAGTGDVNVYLKYGGLAFGAIYSLYSEVATLQIEFEYGEPDEWTGDDPFLWARSYFINQTLVPWTALQVSLHNADFAGWSWTDLTQARSTDPVVDTGIEEPTDLELDQIGLRRFVGVYDFSLAGSEISRFNDQGQGFTDALLSVTFDNPVGPGMMMILSYNVIRAPGAPDATGFTMYMTPIPEPATALLFLLPLAAILHRRRASQTTPTASKTTTRT